MEDQEKSVDEWAPDYTSQCENCGQAPVVTSVNRKTQKETYRSDMCGPCTFGEAACLDPDEW